MSATRTPEEIEELWESLTGEEQKFADAFLGVANLDSRTAARLIGLPMTMGPAMRARKKVSAYLAEMISFEVARPDDLLAKLSRLLQGSISDFYEIGDDGKIGLDWNKAVTSGAFANLDSLEIDPVSGKIKIGLPDKVGILRTLLQYTMPQQSQNVFALLTKMGTEDLLAALGAMTPAPEGV